VIKGTACLVGRHAKKMRKKTAGAIKKKKIIPNGGRKETCPAERQAGQAQQKILRRIIRQLNHFYRERRTGRIFGRNYANHGKKKKVERYEERGMSPYLKWRRRARDVGFTASPIKRARGDTMEEVKLFGQRRGKKDKY